VSKESRAVKAFIDVIEREADPSDGYLKRTEKIQAAIHYIIKLSDKEVKDLVSDSFWNKYPSWTYRSSKGLRRDHGQIITMVVSHICDYCPDLKDALINNADGLFMRETIGFTAGRDRLKACGKACKSKDARVRLKASKYLPLNKVKKLLKDPRPSIRSSVIKRIGIDNCASNLIDDNNFWIRYKGLEAAELSKEEAKSQLEHYIGQLDSSGDCNYYSSWILLALMKKLSDEELLYYLDMDDIAGAQLGDYIKNRLLYAGINIEGEVTDE